MAKVNWQCPNEWSEWVDWLAAGLHARNRWRLPVLMVGMLFANGRRTVTTWLRAAGVSDDYQDYYYALAAFGRKTSSIAERLIILILRTLPLPERLLLVIDDSPTKRYGPKVEGADVHHNPTPGPADQPYLFGHVWVTESLALRHPRWGPIGLPLRAMLYVRKRTMETIPRKRHWYRFATKLQLAARLVEWAAPLLKNAGKTVWVVIDGGYTKAPFLRRVLRIPKLVVVGRLRRDAALRDLPPTRKPGQKRGRGRPRKYGKKTISLAKRAGHRTGLANHRMYAVWEDRHEDVQDVPGDLYPGRRRDSRRVGQRGSRLAPVLLHRPRGGRRGHPGGVRGPRHDRTRLPRREGGLGIGPTTSAEHLDERGRIQFEPLDAYARRAVVLEPPMRGDLRPNRLTVGRRRASPFAREPS